VSDTRHGNLCLSVLGRVTAVTDFTLKTNW
jgi:hypothetical protein